MRRCSQRGRAEGGEHRVMPCRQPVMTSVLCPVGVPGAEVKDLTSPAGHDREA